MITYYVSTTAQLISALKVARPADTISLASGTYSAVSLRGINPSSVVTLTSNDASRPAVFTDLTVRDSSNLTFSNVILESQAGGSDKSFQVLASTGIRFDHILARGPVLGAAATDIGLLVRDSRSVTVTNSEFRDLKHGVSLLDNIGVTVSNSTFHDIRTDGIRGGGNSQVAYTGNMFSNFHAAVGDHPDAIQLWTTNTTASAENIVITGNLVVRGNGDPIQGIFFRDQVGNLPFKNVTIADNLVIGGSYNGITAEGVAGGTVTNNQVIALPDQKSWIRIQNSSGLTVDGNVATAYSTDDGAIPAGNGLVLAATDQGGTALARWLTGHGTPGMLGGSTSAVLTAFGFDPVTTLAHAAAPEAPSVVTVQGTAGDDKLLADGHFASVVVGAEGSDTLIGNGFASTLKGGAGDDVYQVRGTGDLVVENSGSGSDTVSSSIDYTLTANVETLRLTGTALAGNGNALDNRIVGNAMANVLHGFEGADLLQGGDGNDTLFGDGGNDTLRGDDGDDLLAGGSGNDWLIGGDGADILTGEAGDDVLEGGAGDDDMWGGAGRDTFRFRDDSVAAHDVDEVFDFQRGSDLIDLRAIDANSGTVTNDAFILIGGSAFHNKAGELQVKTYGDGVRVTGDVDGDGIADFSIVVHGVTTLTAGDFLL